MSGEVKLGEADYTVFWETLLFMSNILCQISWKGPFDAYSLFKAFICYKMQKTYATNVFFFVNMIKSVTYVSRNPGQPKLITSLMVHYVHI